MKRKILLSVIITLSALLFVLCACSPKQTVSLSEECLRIHIRANSNSEDDQAVKLKVRDELTAFFTTRLENCKTKQDAYNALACSMPQIKCIAQQTLLESNFYYEVRVTLAEEYFPNRDYDGLCFPQGNYDALVVELGTGEGDNWWCVAFPPLCFVPNGDGETVVYKSWVKEIIDRLFG